MSITFLLDGETVLGFATTKRLYVKAIMKFAVLGLILFAIMLVIFKPFTQAAYAGATAYLLAGWGLTVRKRRRFIKRHPKQLLTVEITPEGFEVIEPTVRSEIRWEKGVRKIVTRKSALAFYLDDTRALIIPNEAFPSVEERDLFVETAKRYWQKANALT